MEKLTMQRIKKAGREGYRLYTRVQFRGEVQLHAKKDGAPAYTITSYVSHTHYGRELPEILRVFNAAKALEPAGSIQ